MPFTTKNILTNHSINIGIMANNISNFIFEKSISEIIIRMIIVATSIVKSNKVMTYAINKVFSPNGEFANFESSV